MMHNKSLYHSRNVYKEMETMGRIDNDSKTGLADLKYLLVLSAPILFVINKFDVRYCYLWL